MAGDNETVERFVADVSSYVRDLERAAREADHFGEQNQEARERVQAMGRAAAEAAERAGRAQREAAQEAEKLARGEGDAERAAQAAARAQHDLERAQMAQSRAARAAAQATDHEADQYRQLAKEAAAAGIAQQLATLKASGRLKEHNELIRRTRDEYGGLGKDSDHAFREIEGRARTAFNSFKNSGVQNISMVRAAITLLPLVASVAAGAITLGLGAALAGVAILAAAKAKEVKAAFSGLKKHVVTELEGWAKPFQATLVHIAGYARSTFDSFGPELKSSFGAMAPMIDKFVHNFTDGLREFRPLIGQITEAFGKITGDLGGRMDTILKNLADGLSGIVRAASEHPEQLGQLIEDISSLAKFAGQLTPVLAGASGTIHTVSNALGGLGDILGNGKLDGGLATLTKSMMAFATGPVGMAVLGFNQFKNAVGQGKGPTLDTAGAVNAMKTALDRASASTGQANNAQTTSSQLMQLASKSAKDLKAALDNLSGKELSAREAAAQYGTSIIAMTKALKDNGKAHGFASAKGIQNEQALDSLAQAAQQNAVAMRDNGASAKQVGTFMASARTRIIKMAEGMGYSRTAAIALADKLIGVKGAVNAIPKSHKTKVSADTSAAQAEARHMVTVIEAMQAYIKVHVIGGQAEGGPVLSRATGGPVGQQQPGMVRGAGTGTSDSILTNLSDGEYVMTAAATKAFAPMLAMMNAAASSGPKVGAGHDIKRGRVNRGGVAPIEEGHYGVRPPPRTYAQLARAKAPATIMHVTNNHYAIQGSVWAEKELLDVVQRQAARRNVRNPGLAQFGAR